MLHLHSTDHCLLIANSNMDSLSSTIRKCNVQLKLDNPTEGYGNCFPNAIVQQCQRPEIQAWLKENKPWAMSTNHQVLRKKIKHFALNSPHKTLFDYKTKYEAILLQEDKTTWTNYWVQMGRVGRFCLCSSNCLVHWARHQNLSNNNESSKPFHNSNGKY